MRFLSTLTASILGSLIAFGLILFLGLVFLVGLAASSEQTPGVRSGSVLVAELSGAWPEAVSGDPLAATFGGEARLDLHDVTGAFRRAAVDPRIEAVWLKVGAVGSGWAALDAVRRSIEVVRKAGKPVYASSADFMMNESGYYLASAADSVFLEEEGIFEFNGFSLDVLFYHRAMERLGVQAQAIRAGRYKTAVEPFTRDDLSSYNEEQLTALAEDVQNRFLSEVMSSRSMAAEPLNALLAAGGTFTSREALDAGLVDALAHADQIETLVRRRLGMEEDERIPSVTLRRYARVSDEQAGIPSSGRNEVAVVIAEGQIMSGDSQTNPLLDSGSLGSDTIAKAMRDARESTTVKAVVLRINSPGGFAPAADAMLREIELTSREKPVIVSMGDMAASGGYWIAMAADSIVAEPLTLTGSIGVFSLMFDASVLLRDRIGITFDGVSTAPSADMLSMLRPLRSEEVARLEASVDQTYANFLTKVSAARGMTIEQVDAVGEGRVWSGVSAHAVGLVDVLGGLDTAVRIAARRVGLEDGSYRIREFPRQKTFMERLSASLETRVAVAATRFGFGTRLLAPETSITRRALSDLESVLRSAGSVQARMPMTIGIR